MKRKGVGSKSVLAAAIPPASDAAPDTHAAITNQKQPEAALKDSELRYRRLFEAARDGILILDADTGAVVDVNPFLVELLGFSRETFLGKELWELGFFRDIIANKDSFETLRAEGYVRYEDKPLETKDGRRVDVEFVSNVYLVNGHNVIHCNVRDISARKRADQALRASERMLADSQRLGHVGSWFWGMTGPFQWSEETYRIYGVSPHRFTPTPEAVLGLVDPGDRPAMRSWLVDYTAGDDHELEFRVTRPDGAVRVLLGCGRAVAGSANTPAYMAGTVQDITERKRAEDERRLSAQRQSLHVDQTPLAVIEFDLDGRVREWNPAARTIFGFSHEEAIGRHLSFIVPAAIRPHMDGVWAETVAYQGGVRSTNENVTKDGRTITCEWVNTSLIGPDGRPIGVASMAQDVTERRRAEAEKAALVVQLHQAQKMESVGRLAGGVAHDFNNMLGVILGYSDLALAQVDPALPLHADLEEIRKAAVRSADLTRQLLAFARRQTVTPKVVDLNGSVGSMLTMLHRLIGEDIEVTWQPAASLWAVNVDPSQIDQVLTNLCVNSRDAISGVGKVTIKTGNITLDEHYCAANVGAVPGDYVQLTVRDTGCGMVQDTLSHLFEPFFTTKAIGKGTGLGLATVYGIVKQNGGYIDVSSQPNLGTTFSVYLPRFVGKAPPARSADAPRPTAHGGETILLVEDEPSILRVTQRILEQLGYTVLAASTPGEASGLAREYGGEIDLLVTDVVMPEMNGRVLAKNLLSLYPHLKRLFMSGYAADVIAHGDVLEDGVNFIQKPFSAEGLAAKVHDALAAAD
jgi:PAS domain S-box-containing protein